MWVTITLTRSYGEEQRQLKDLAFGLLVAQGSSRSGILSGHLQTRDLSSGPQMWWFMCKDWSASGQQGFVHWTGAGFVVNALQSCKKMSRLHRSVKSLLMRDHNILTLTSSAVVVQDFTAGRVQLHSSHRHSSSVFDRISLPMAQRGESVFLLFPFTVRGALAGKRADSTGITVSLAPPKTKKTYER